MLRRASHSTCCGVRYNVRENGVLPPVVAESKLWAQFWMKCCFEELVVEIAVPGRVVRSLWIVPVIAARLDFFCRALF